MKNSPLWLLVTIIFSILIFSPSLGNFFWGDDWYHLEVSQISSFNEFLNFFSFSQTPQSTPFYRPLSTQVVFFTLHKFFGLNALPFHLFFIYIFTVSLFLLYKFTEKLFKDKKISFLAVLFYGTSATNFPRLYYLSNFQEIMMMIFVLLSFIGYLKDTTTSRFTSLIFFMLALGSKETAVVLPMLFFAHDLLRRVIPRSSDRGMKRPILDEVQEQEDTPTVRSWVDSLRRKISFKKLVPYIIVLLAYLSLRIIFWNSLGKDSYGFDPSPFKLLNTTFWYSLWSFGAPEFLVDYIGSGFKILPKLYLDFPIWSQIILTIVALVVFCFSLSLFLKRKFLGKDFVFLVSFFLISLLPIVFLPWHKFAYELTLPLVGFAIMLSYITSKFKPLWIVLFTALYLVLNLSTNYLDYKNHPSKTRSKISKEVVTYFTARYPNPPTDTYFEFINDTYIPNPEWGSSKQIAQAISKSNLFKVLYWDNSYEVYYQDLVEEKPVGKRVFSINTSIFLK